MRSCTLLVVVSALALAPLSAQRLIAIDSGRAVSSIDFLTGVRTPIGTASANVATAGGLAYDPATGRMFCTSTSNDSLYTLDVTNWNATLVGPYGDTAIVMHGLEWDSSTSTLYGMSSHNGGLYTIDTATGAATLVGQTGLTSFQNLAYDPTLNVMWLTSSSTDSFYSIDRATGAATLVGPLLGPTNPNGLAFVLDNASLYAVDNSTDTLYTIDRTTGQATVVAPMGSSNLLGLAYIPGTGQLSRAAHACGPTTILVTGHAGIGSTVVTSLGGVTALPFVGYGVVPLGLPFCGCTIGHEWAVAVGGPTAAFTIPANVNLIGSQLLIQGTDFLGAGGCADPLLTTTDTITVTIGT